MTNTRIVQSIPRPKRPRPVKPKPPIAAVIVTAKTARKIAAEKHWRKISGRDD
jgi:hypothetical protein